MAGEPASNARVKTHHAVRPAITFERAAHREADRRHRAFLARFHFDQDRHCARDLIQHLPQRLDGILAAVEGRQVQLCSTAARHRAGLSRQPVKIEIVDYDRLIVAGFLHIAFDAKAPRHCCGKGTRRILRHIATMQAAMGKPRTLQPVRPPREWRWGQPAIKRR